MTISINFPPDTIEKLQAQARASGKDVETLVKEAVEANLVVSGLSFREILKPIQDEVEASGMSEEEVNALAERVVTEGRGIRALLVPPPKNAEKDVRQVVLEMLAFRDHEGPTLGRKANSGTG